MAQWAGGFSGNTHVSAIEDAEELLRHAATVFLLEADPEKRRKKAKNVRSLAKRLLRTRVRFLKALISERHDPREEVMSTRIQETTSLKQRLANTEDEGIAGILREFSASEALVSD